MRNASLSFGLLCGAALCAQTKLRYIENKGQWPAPVRFKAEAPGATIWVENGAILLDRYDAQAVARLTPAEALNQAMAFTLYFELVNLAEENFRIRLLRDRNQRHRQAVAAGQPSEPMRETIHALAPGARLVRLTAPPVMGAVILGMEAGGLRMTPTLRARLLETTFISMEL